MMNALRMARFRRKPMPGLLHHSDRGSQYCSGDYRALLGEYGMIASMSRKGNCWDNAPMESFFNSLKNERVFHEDYATREEAARDMFDYIEKFYNRRRRHSVLDYPSPAQPSPAQPSITLPGLPDKSWRLDEVVGIRKNTAKLKASEKPFLNAGIFPLQKVNQSETVKAKDKWFYGRRQAWSGFRKVPRPKSGWGQPIMIFKISVVL